MIVSIIENSLVGAEGSGADYILSKPHFETLKNTVLHLSSDSIAQLVFLKGKQVVRFKNHVGVVPIAKNFQIEILPKISEDSHQARLALVQLLRHVTNLPFKSLTNSATQTAKIPLWQVFVGLFLDEVANIIQKGISKNYTFIQTESAFLRGKWLVNQQIRQPQKNTFFVEFDQFMANIYPNQLLKTCLDYLSKSELGIENQRKILPLLSVFENVETLKAIPPHKITRLNHYQKAIDWATVILNQQSWLSQSGNNQNLSLLFAAEQLFELYVSAGFKKYFIDNELFTQKSFQYLVANHAGKSKFQLRPDIILKTKSQHFIFDAKWKIIDATDAKNNYGIDQRDLYQLYAYGQKYEAQNLFLIYPSHSKFNAPLPPFQFDNSVSLTVWPFDITKPLSEEMNKIREFLAIK